LNLQKIRAEQQNIIHITMDDLVYDLHLQGLHIPQHTQELLTSTDEHGGFLFYGVQYSANTPRIIYPHVMPTFVRATNMASTARAICPSGSAVSISVKAKSVEEQCDSVEQGIADVAIPTSHGAIDKESAFEHTLSSSSSTVMGGSSRSKQNMAETMFSTWHHHMPNSTSDSANETPALFDFHAQQGADDPAQMSMEWGKLSIGLLQRIVRMQQIDTVVLLPMSLFRTQQRASWHHQKSIAVRRFEALEVFVVNKFEVGCWCCCICMLFSRANRASSKATKLFLRK